MRLVKRGAIIAGLMAGAALVTASAALAHDDRWDDRGWKRGHAYGHRHHHHHHDRYVFERSRPVVVERPVIYREVSPYPYYPPGPPSLNFNIPLR